MSKVRSYFLFYAHPTPNWHGETSETQMRKKYFIFFYNILVLLSPENGNQSKEDEYA